MSGAQRDHLVMHVQRLTKKVLPALLSDGGDALCGVLAQSVLTHFTCAPEHTLTWLRLELAEALDRHISNDPLCTTVEPRLAVRLSGIGTSTHGHAYLAVPARVQPLMRSVLATWAHLYSTDTLRRLSNSVRRVPTSVVDDIDGIDGIDGVETEGVDTPFTFFPTERERVLEELLALKGAVLVQQMQTSPYSAMAISSDPLRGDRDTARVRTFHGPCPSLLPCTQTLTHSTKSWSSAACVHAPSDGTPCSVIEREREEEGEGNIVQRRVVECRGGGGVFTSPLNIVEGGGESDIRVSPSTLLSLSMLCRQVSSIVHSPVLLEVALYPYDTQTHDGERERERERESARIVVLDVVQVVLPPSPLLTPPVPTHHTLSPTPSSEKCFSLSRLFCGGKRERRDPTQVGKSAADASLYLSLCRYMDVQTPNYLPLSLISLSLASVMPSCLEGEVGRESGLGVAATKHGAYLSLLGEGDGGAVLDAFVPGRTLTEGQGPNGGNRFLATASSELESLFLSAPTMLTKGVEVVTLPPVMQDRTTSLLCAMGDALALMDKGAERGIASGTRHAVRAAVRHVYEDGDMDSPPASPMSLGHSPSMQRIHSPPRSPSGSPSKTKVSTDTDPLRQKERERERARREQYPLEGAVPYVTCTSKGDTPYSQAGGELLSLSLFATQTVCDAVSSVGGYTALVESAQQTAAKRGMRLSDVPPTLSAYTSSLYTGTTLHTAMANLRDSLSEMPLATATSTVLLEGEGEGQVDREREREEVHVLSCLDALSLLSKDELVAAGVLFERPSGPLPSSALPLSPLVYLSPLDARVDRLLPVLEGVFSAATTGFVEGLEGQEGEGEGERRVYTYDCLDALSLSHRVCAMLLETVSDPLVGFDSLSPSEEQTLPMSLSMSLSVRYNLGSILLAIARGEATARVVAESTSREGEGEGGAPLSASYVEDTLPPGVLGVTLGGSPTASRVGASILEASRKGGVSPLLGSRHTGRCISGCQALSAALLRLVKRQGREREMEREAELPTGITRLQTVQSALNWLAVAPSPRHIMRLTALARASLATLVTRSLCVVALRAKGVDVFGPHLANVWQAASARAVAGAAPTHLDIGLGDDISGGMHRQRSACSRVVSVSMLSQFDTTNRNALHQLIDAADILYREERERQTEEREGEREGDEPLVVVDGDGVTPEEQRERNILSQFGVSPSASPQRYSGATPSYTSHLSLSVYAATTMPQAEGEREMDVDGEHDRGTDLVASHSLDTALSDSISHLSAQEVLGYLAKASLIDVDTLTDHAIVTPQLPRQRFEEWHRRQKRGRERDCIGSQGLVVNAHGATVYPAESETGTERETLCVGEVQMGREYVPLSPSASGVDSAAGTSSTPYLLVDMRDACGDAERESEILARYTHLLSAGTGTCNTLLIVPEAGVTVIPSLHALYREMTVVQRGRVIVGVRGDASALVNHLSPSAFTGESHSLTGSAILSSLPPSPISQRGSPVSMSANHSPVTHKGTCEWCDGVVVVGHLQDTRQRGSIPSVSRVDVSFREREGMGMYMEVHACPAEIGLGPTRDVKGDGECSDGSDVSDTLTDDGEDVGMEGGHISVATPHLVVGRRLTSSVRVEQQTLEREAEREGTASSTSDLSSGVDSDIERESSVKPWATPVRTLTHQPSLIIVPTIDVNAVRGAASLRRGGERDHNSASESASDDDDVSDTVVVSDTEDDVLVEGTLPQWDGEEGVERVCASQAEMERESSYSYTYSSDGTFERKLSLSDSRLLSQPGASNSSIHHSHSHTRSAAPSRATSGLHTARDIEQGGVDGDREVYAVPDSAAGVLSAEVRGAAGLERIVEGERRHSTTCTPRTHITYQIDDVTYAPSSEEVSVSEESESEVVPKREKKQMRPQRPQASLPPSGSTTERDRGLEGERESDWGQEAGEGYALGTPSSLSPRESKGGSLSPRVAEAVSVFGVSASDIRHEGSHTTVDGMGMSPYSSHSLSLLDSARGRQIGAYSFSYYADAVPTESGVGERMETLQGERERERGRERERQYRQFIYNMLLTSETAYGGVLSVLSQYLSPLLSETRLTKCFTAGEISVVRSAASHIATMSTVSHALQMSARQCVEAFTDSSKQDPRADDLFQPALVAHFAVRYAECMESLLTHSPRERGGEAEGEGEGDIASVWTGQEEKGLKRGSIRVKTQGTLRSINRVIRDVQRGQNKMEAMERVLALDRAIVYPQGLALTQPGRTHISTVSDVQCCVHKAVPTDMAPAYPGSTLLSIPPSVPSDMLPCTVPCDMCILSDVIMVLQKVKPGSISDKVKTLSKGLVRGERGGERVAYRLLASLAPLKDVMLLDPPQSERQGDRHSRDGERFPHHTLQLVCDGTPDLTLPGTPRDRERERERGGLSQLVTVCAPSGQVYRRLCRELGDALN
ncbi:hypothetical protein KIPB_000834 [Kipferlia bialata]|uniref:Uncharacterized protein n=1 Tax=Kipferlia bialata TaxID=797122 RepID=A0A9K3CPE2_9EUKA|nr:hypothetical protein KIPB_000834 [Kipferlia bialata]|eukprot:g834.t1